SREADSCNLRKRIAGVYRQRRALCCSRRSRIEGDSNRAAPGRLDGKRRQRTACFACNTEPVAVCSAEGEAADRQGTSTGVTDGNGLHRHGTDGNGIEGNR